jgi:hypothetical protein
MKQQIYQLIQDDVIKKIKSGVLRPGDKLPTESEFSQLYDTSKSSVKKALNQLVSKGYLYAIQRVGYYVSIPKHNKYVITFNPSDLIYRGEKIEPIRLEPISGNWEQLGSQSDPADARIFFLPQLIVIGKIPAGFLLYKIFYRKGLAANRKKQPQIFADPDSIEAFFKSFAHHRKLKIYGEAASQTISSLLNIPADTPVFVVEEAYFDQYEKLLGKLIVYYRKEYMQLNGLSSRAASSGF